MNSHQLVIDLSISAQEYLRLYRGEVDAVVARARDGRRVRFPANILRRFVTREGVYGTFRIVYDPQGRFQQIERL